MDTKDPVSSEATYGVDTKSSPTAGIGDVEITSVSSKDEGAVVTIDPAAERRLVWKFDLRILVRREILCLCV